MYFLSAHCGYCNQECSRDNKNKSDLPYLYEPETLFVKKFVCENCMKKINQGMTKLFESFIKEE